MGEVIFDLGIPKKDRHQKYFACEYSSDGFAWGAYDFGGLAWADLIWVEKLGWIWFGYTCLG